MSLLLDTVLFDTVLSFCASTEVNALSIVYFQASQLKEMIDLYLQESDKVNC